MRLRHLTIAVAAVVALGACASGPGTGDAGPSSESATLRVGVAPVGQDADRRALLTPALATFEPADPGAAVTIERSTDGGETWVPVEGGTGEQGARGRASIMLPALAPGATEVFRAVGADGGPTSEPVEPRTQAEVFVDDFDDPERYEQQWAQRYTNLYHGSRLCSTPNPDQVALGDGVLTLSVEQVQAPGATSPGDASYTCDSGIWDNAMIGTALAPEPFTFTYGTAAARMRVQSGQGTHSAFWLQQTDPAGAEIDVVEYYGDGNENGVQSKIHYGTGEDLESSGGTVKTGGVVAEGATPADGWHVYSVEWTPEGYVFFIDGRETWRTDQPGVAAGPEEVVLSLLTSDWNLPNMNDPDTTVEVDWVRVWQDPDLATPQG